MPNFTPDLVAVRFDAVTGARGQVYHRLTCTYVANMYGYKTLSWRDASESGLRACLRCHKSSIKQFLCPNASCPDVILIPTAHLGGRHIALWCPRCGLLIRQREEEESHGSVLVPATPADVAAVTRRRR